MAESMLAYDPVRMQTLAAMTRAAISWLRGITTDEPMADDTIAALRSIALGLEQHWLSYIVGVAGDTSMSEWDSEADVVAVRIAGPMVGAQTGVPSRAGQPATTVDPELVAEAEALVVRILDGDQDAVPALNDLLEGNPELAAALLVELGPSGFVELMVSLATPPAAPRSDDETAELATALAEALPAAELAAGFTPVELGTALTDAMATTGRDGLGYAPVAVQLILTTASPEVQAAFVTHASAAERTAGYRFVAASNGDAAYYSPVSLPAAMYGSPNLGDPLATALGRLATTPELARELLADAETHTYLLLERDWNDGYGAVLTASAAASAGPDLLDPSNPPDPETVQIAGEIASRTVNQLGARGVTWEDVSPEGSEAAGRILGVHAAAMDATVTTTVANGSVTLDDGEVLGGATVIRTDPVLGPQPLAVFGSYELGNFTQIAVSTEGGQLNVIVGVEALQQVRIDAAAGMVANGEMGTADFAVVQAQAAHLEGFVVQQSGWQAQDAGRAEDQARAATVNLLIAVSRLPLVGVANIVGAPRATTNSADLYTMIQQWAATDYEAQAIATATTDGDTAVSYLNYRIAAALDEAGVIDVELPPWETFVESNGGDQIAYGTTTVTEGAETNVDGFVFDPQATRLAIIAIQLDPFNEMPEGWDPPTSGG